MSKYTEEFKLKIVKEHKETHIWQKVYKRNMVSITVKLSNRKKTQRTKSQSHQRIKAELLRC